MTASKEDELYHSALLGSSTVKKLKLSMTYMVTSVLMWRMQDFCQNSQKWEKRPHFWQKNDWKITFWPF